VPHPHIPFSATLGHSSAPLSKRILLPSANLVNWFSLSTTVPGVSLPHLLHFRWQRLCRLALKTHSLPLSRREIAGAGQKFFAQAAPHVGLAFGVRGMSMVRATAGLTGYYA
jgi:hypothetical protein